MAEPQPGARGGRAPAPASPTVIADADRHRRFLADAMPLRAELDRAARRYAHNVHDAEDLVSETYLKAWAAFDTFQGGTNMRAWMHRILCNTWIDSYRRAEIRPRETLTDFIAEAQQGAAVTRSGAPSPEESKLHETPSEAIVSAIQELPTSQQAVVFYADVCDLPFKKIAELSGIPVGTVMSRIHRARCRLRTTLRAPGGDADPRTLSA